MSEPSPRTQAPGRKPPLVSLTLPVDGIHCAGCVSRIETALKAVRGLGEASVNLATGEVQISFDPAKTDLNTILETIDDTGYQVPIVISELGVQGMHCAACVSRVERILGKGPGVVGAEVSLATESARVRFVPGVLDLPALVEKVGKAGFQLQDETGEEFERALREREEKREAEYKDLLRRFWVGVLLGTPVALIGHAHWIPGLRNLDHSVMRGLWVLSGLLTVPIMAYVGRRFFTGAWSAFKNRDATMDTLVALGTGSAWVYSTLAVLVPGFFPEGAAHPFYEATAVVITLVT